MATAVESTLHLEETFFLGIKPVHTFRFFPLNYWNAALEIYAFLSPWKSMVDTNTKLPQEKPETFQVWHGCRP